MPGIVCPYSTHTKDRKEQGAGAAAAAAAALVLPLTLPEYHDRGLLHLAAEFGRSGVVAFLLQRGFDDTALGGCVVVAVDVVVRGWDGPTDRPIDPALAAATLCTACFSTV